MIVFVWMVFVWMVFVWRAQGELVNTLRSSLSLQSVNGLDSQKSAAHSKAGSNTREVASFLNYALACSQHITPAARGFSKLVAYLFVCDCSRRSTSPRM